MTMGNINCSKGREYNSSLPIRYIPKEYRESEKSELSTNRSANSEKHSSLGSDIKRDEFFYKDVQAPNARNSVLGAEFRTQDERPNNNTNDVGIGMMTRVVQLTVIVA